MAARTKELTTAAAALLVAGAAFALGRLSASDDEAAPVVAVETTRIADTVSATNDAHAAGCDHSAALNHPPVPLEGGAEVEGTLPSSTALDLDPVLQLARAAHDAPDDHHLLEAVAAASGELEVRVHSDPAALTTALIRFAESSEVAELELLAAVLSRVNDLEVEELALDMAANAALPAKRPAALDLLDGLDSRRGTEVALAALTREQDVDVRRAALFAIPEPNGASLQSAAQVVDAMNGVIVSDRDPETRRRAVLQLGEWHRDRAELGPVLQLLASDPSVDVRAACAFALERAGRRDAEVVSVLTETVQREGEDPLVRENAWRALARMGPLPPRSAQVFAAYRDQRDAALEAN